jgi:hypothetical protein
MYEFYVFSILHYLHKPQIQNSPNYSLKNGCLYKTFLHILIYKKYDESLREFVLTNIDNDKQ